MKEKRLKLKANVVENRCHWSYMHFREYFKKNLNFKHQNLTSNTNGITLISLIITIIVMLILVGVTVNVAINGGLFEKAKKAKIDTQNATNAENELSEGKVNIDGRTYNSIDEYVGSAENQGEASKGNWVLSAEGDTVTDGNVILKIGDYVNYTYDTVENEYPLPKTITGYSSDKTISQTTDLKWRVLGVDLNGCLTLISDKPTTGTTVGLKNAIGYNNGVYILNDICAKQYSNKEKGITARNLTIEDVEGGYSEKGIAAKDKYSDAVQYGKTKTYTDTSKLNYPVIYAKENGSGIGVTEEEAKEGPESKIKKDGIGGSVSYYNENQLTTKPEGKEIDTASGALSCKQTYYGIDSMPTNYCKNSYFYNMIFETESKYWLASRYCGCNSSYSNYGMRLIRNSDVHGYYFYRSDDAVEGTDCSLRPVVSLGSNIKIIQFNGETSKTDTKQMHSLSK